MIGKTVAHYRILEKLGQGGMGVVYRAEDTRLGRSVALKALPAEFARDPMRRQRFVQEARAAAALSHAGIAGVYALEEVGEELYIAFEYVKGQSLRTLVTPGGMELDTLLKMMSGIADALAAAHALGIVHRDLKPENILRTPEGNTKILDFGLARFMPQQQEETASVRLTDAGSIVGTVSYMSPEQLEGKEPDCRSDVFSFGVMLYELATGVRPFDGSSSSSTISRILTAEPVPLMQRNPVAPPELDRIARKCLRKRREERYQSTQDLKVDLENLSRERSETGSVAAPSEPTEESAFMQQKSILAVGNPRRWWEIHQIAEFIKAAFVVYLGWLARGYTGFTGLFVTLLVLCAGILALRIYLIGLGIFSPAALPKEDRKLSPWIGAAQLAAALVGFIFSGWLVKEHIGLATVLIAVGMGSIVNVFLLEPAMRRSAFPSSAAMAATSPEALAHAATVRDRRVMAGIQLLYVLPVAFWFFKIGPLMDVFKDGPWTEERKSQVVFLVGSLGMIFLHTPMAAMMWQGNRKVIRNFEKWFIGLMLAYLPAIFMLTFVAMKYANMAVALFVLPIVAGLPVYQRKLARQILARDAAGPGE